MTTKTTRIQGYSIELEVEDGETHCYIEKREYSASLACLESTGVLTRYTGGGPEELIVPGGVIEAITEWAEANGY